MVPLTIVFSVMLLGGAVADWMKVPKLVETVERLNVPKQLIPLLPICKTLGATGLLIGLKSKPLGIVAGLALIAYFICAVGFHVKAKDPMSETAPAALFGVLALAAVILRSAA